VRSAGVTILLLALTLVGALLVYTLHSSDRQVTSDAGDEIVTVAFADGSVRRVRYLPAETPALEAAAEVGAPWAGSIMLIGALVLAAMKHVRDRRRAAGTELRSGLALATEALTRRPGTVEQDRRFIHWANPAGEPPSEVLEHLYEQVLDAQAACWAVTIPGSDVEAERNRTRDKAIDTFLDLTDYTSANRFWLNAMDLDASQLQSALTQAVWALETAPADYEPDRLARELSKVREEVERQLKDQLDGLDRAA
jgi:hypothetical protein